MTSKKREKRPPRYGVLLTIAYDGTDFRGYQRQTPDLRTVQAVVEEALQDFDPTASALRAASRTDAGVHALAQKAAFTTERAIPPIAYLKELERRLPPDVAIREAESCVPNYAPRFDARYKIYHYRVRVGPTRDPLRDRYHYHLHGAHFRPGARSDECAIATALNLEALEEAARLFVGRHDFRAFRDTGDRRENTIREMSRVAIQTDREYPDALRIIVEGDAFMKQMVRIMVGTLLEVAREKHPPSWISELLCADATRSDAGPTAPPEGLFLAHTELGRQAHEKAEKESRAEEEPVRAPEDGQQSEADA